MDWYGKPRLSSIFFMLSWMREGKKTISRKKKNNPHNFIFLLSFLLSFLICCWSQSNKERFKNLLFYLREIVLASQTGIKVNFKWWRRKIVTIKKDKLWIFFGINSTWFVGRVWSIISQAVSFFPPECDTTLVCFALLYATIFTVRCS